MFKHNLAAVLNTQRPDKKGYYPLRIRATIQRKVSYYPTGIMLKKEQFVNGEVVNHPNKALYNTKIRAMISEMDQDYTLNNIGGNQVTKITKREMALKFCEYAERIIKRHASTMSPGTIKQKNVYLNKFREFNPSIKLKEVDRGVLLEFENWCRNVKGNNDNSVWGNSKFVKSILNDAVEDGIFKISPLHGFKGTKYKDPLRIVLTADEIKKIEQFADNPKAQKKLRDVAGWFLFSVYTGLRYGDLNRFNDFVNGKVLMETEKTNAVVSIFATKKILEAKKRLTPSPITNQKMNDHLKLIALACNIDKRITVHLARHTFAVQFLERGGRVEVLSKLLGHTTLKTTSIYAKISTKLADEEMKKVWDK